MSIVVKCQCGKMFKAKDQMAGRKVRCPGCREPLRIPGGESEKGASAVAKKAKSSSTGVDEAAALLKFEQVQQRKAQTAETEAAYREEQNKLIESYDQIAGRTPAKDKKKKGELTEVGVKKVTIFTKIADAFGVVFGTLLAKYLMIALLASGAVLGSIFVVRQATSYMSEETASQTPKQQRIRNLYKDIGAAIEEGRLSEANSMLQKVLEIDPSKETHGTYKHWRKELDKAFAGE